MAESQDTSQSIRIPVSGRREITISGLTGDESETLQGCLLRGTSWVRGSSTGRLEHVPSYKPLPDPVADQEMAPFWCKPTVGDDGPTSVYGFDRTRELSLDNCSPSIFIESLCGYNHTPESYQKEARKLERWGFVQMRSMRGTDGKFWELWYLPCLSYAKGELGDVVRRNEQADGKGQPKAVLEFLRKEVSFGSLDLSVQRMAMVMDD